MEKQIVCVLCDMKAKSFYRPVFFRNREEACRSFADLCADTDTLIGKHPTDFQLLQIGVYDGDTAEIAPLPVHEVICDGVSVNV